MGALLLGGVVALASVAVHRVDVRGLPVGLALAVAASVATAWELWRSDVPRTAAAYCLGWVAVLGVTLVGKPEGDFALAGDVPGYTLMVTGFLLVVMGISALRARAPTPGTGTAAS